MAYGWLGEAEAISSRSQATEIPNCEEDPQQIEIEFFISLIHVEYYDYEFDLVQEDRHLLRISARFNSPLDAALRLELAERRGAFSVVAAIETFDDAIDAVSV